MKTLLSIAVASLAVAAVADSYSPTIGVTAVTTDKKNTIVAVPFDSLNGGEGIPANELVKTAGLTEGTSLYIYSGSSYSAWTLVSGQWVAAISASTATPVGAGTPGAGSTAPLAAGSAIWLVRPESDKGSKTFYIYGKWKNPTSKTVAVGAQLVANPLQSPLSLAEKISNPTAGDEIVTATDGVSERYAYRVNKKTKEGMWRKDNAEATLPTIPAGQGFWYVAAAAGATISFE